MDNETHRSPDGGARRMEREALTLTAMVQIYCRAHHGTSGELCDVCDELRLYALERLSRCPFGGDKPTCAQCTIHCYKPQMQLRIREVMRFAGPRMLLRHPLLAVHHVLNARTQR
jgi:hypothetical protein